MYGNRKERMSKLKKLFLHPSMILIALDHKGLIRLSDKLYLKIVFWNMLGRKLNLDIPETFNEKIQWLKLYDRKKCYTKMVDKAAVKQYLSKKIDKRFIIPSIGIYDSFDDIDFSALPNEFVLKCSHDSGSVFVCKNKKAFLNSSDFLTIRNKFKKALRKNYYYLWREWPYKNVKRRIVVEKYLDDIAGDVIDYKFMCFGGKVKYIFTCSERFSDDGLKVTWFDQNWNKLDFERHYPASKKVIEKPKNLKKMIELAENLSAGIPFVRIDFYNIDGKIYFGEYTFYPGAGLEEFTPEIWDKKLGDLINLPEKHCEK